MPDEHEVIRTEFERAAVGFSERTRGRFDDLDAVSFSRATEGCTVLEVGAGTGSFLALFEPLASSLIALDLTPGMLARAREAHPGMLLLLADGGRIPLRSGSVDLVTSAQVLHHIREPVPVLKEMRRVAGPDGWVLVVDQVATERYEEQAFMDQLEALRDPSHAASRSPSVLRMLMRTAGLQIVEERLVEGRSRLSEWMWAVEFPPERIAAVTDFVERFGAETGMDWERDGDDWTFTRRRMMLLASR